MCHPSSELGVAPAFGKQRPKGSMLHPSSEHGVERPQGSICHPWFAQTDTRSVPKWPRMREKMLTSLAGAAGAPAADATEDPKSRQRTTVTARLRSRRIPTPFREATGTSLHWLCGQPPERYGAPDR